MSKRKQTAMKKCRWYASTATTEEYDPPRMMRLIRAAIREAVRDATTCDCEREAKCHEVACQYCRRKNEDFYTPRTRPSPG